mmetsp:Transcript_24666/g.59475  ORF Transcript_24666/g.59475 Transcript_24666/m.59475 type:complete len:302 (+) Transcript_24666:81-986(+)
MMIHAMASVGRLENTTTCLPIAYGSVAFYLGKKSDEYHTHRWTLYVRSPDQNFDLGKAISKVVFQLHPSFPQPTRELTEPPFEVTETGWGEFEASIRIIWSEAADERSTILTHGIRLYPNKAPATSADPSAYMNTTVPVVAEKYDEVVFTNPKVDFHRSLVDGHKNSNQPSYPLSNEPSVLEHFRTYGDEEDIKAMLAAKKFLEGELRNVKDRLLRVDVELDEVKHSLAATKDMDLAAASGMGGASTIGGAESLPSGSTKGGTAGASGAGGSKSRNKSSKKKASAALESSSHSVGKKVKSG